VWRRGRDQQHDISRAGLQLREIPGAPVLVILGALHGGVEGGRASGEQGQSPVRGPGEGRVQLDAVEQTQAPGGPGAHVDEPAPGLQPRDGALHRLGQLGGGLADGDGGDGLILDEGLHQLAASVVIELLVAWVGLFRAGRQHGITGSS
jgi:hypothetical protein